MKIRIDEMMNAVRDIKLMQNAIELDYKMGKFGKDEYEQRLCSLKLTSDAFEALENGLNEVQKRCSERTLSAKEIVEYVIKIDDKYRNIPKKYMKGTLCRVSPFCERFAKSYKYKPMGTFFTVEHTGKGWIVTGIGREDVNCSESNRFRIRLNSECKEEVMKQIEQFKF